MCLDVCIKRRRESAFPGGTFKIRIKSEIGLKKARFAFRGIRKILNTKKCLRKQNDQQKSVYGPFALGE